jgi:V8-like Glu-specific endopeptidase
VTKRIFLSLLCACAVSAIAQDIKPVSPKAAVNPVKSEEERIQAIREYWTPERLAGALPMPIPKVDPATVEPNSAPVFSGTSGSAPGALPAVRIEPEIEAPRDRFPLNQGPEQGLDVNTEATPSPDAFSYEMPFNNYRTGINNQYPYATIGKLFFTIPAGASEKPGGYVCSAAVVGNSRIVVTARHCMFDYVSKKWYSNWVFYPQWKDGGSTTVGGETSSGQPGAWFPEQEYTWVSSSTLSLSTGWDIGILIMHDSNGKGCGNSTGTHTIGYFTGYLGYSYGGNFSQRQWNIFGYPQAAPFEGNYLYQDNGATGVVNPLGSNNIVQVGNPQTGGTSGGPWILGFDPGPATDPAPVNNTTGANTNRANGVNSYQYTDPSEPLAINGTIFQESNFLNLYNGALKLTCN